MKDLQHVLNALKPPFRRLNRNKYADIYQQQAISRTELLHIQDQLHHDPTNSDLIQKEASCREKYVTINQFAMMLI